ncbi:MAG TPA: carboxymuconolactone decarboxylase family protein [Solirubrobacteraceae bacterium]
MTRIEGVPPRKANPIVRLIYRMSRRELGRAVDPVSVYAHAPGLLIGYGMLEKAFASSKRVDESIKMLAELKAATMVGCEFCIDIASQKSRESGLSDDQLLALGHHTESDLFSPLQKLVLDYAAAMTRTPAQVSDELFERLREHFDDGQLVELTTAVAIENYRARFNWAFGIGSAGFTDGMVCAAPEVSVDHDAALS